jgi:hypothetical protein
MQRRRMPVLRLAGHSRRERSKSAVSLPTVCSPCQGSEPIVGNVRKLPDRDHATCMTPGRGQRLRGSGGNRLSPSDSRQGVREMAHMARIAATLAGSGKACSRPMRAPPRRTRACRPPDRRPAKRNDGRTGRCWPRPHLAAGISGVILCAESFRQHGPAGQWRFHGTRTNAESGPRGGREDQCEIATGPPASGRRRLHRRSQR